MISNLSPNADGAFAVLTSTDSELPEVAALENGKLRRLSHQNDTWLSQLLLGTTDELTSTSKDGTEVHGLIVKPPTYTQGQKYPTLLRIHGGPNGQDDHSFSFEREWFAANGYVVVRVNYRGSDGRGSAYQKAIFADWGNKEVVDLLGAMDQVQKMGIADPDRLGIGGWSYGGILTDYTIATDGRFKAATSGAGSALQLSMYGVDEYITQYENEIGPPWKSQDLWIKISYPFFHADRIHTPTLFLGGDTRFQRAAGWWRADVSGAAQPRHRHGAGDLSQPVPRDHGAELQDRSLAALPGVVRQVPEEDRAVDDVPLEAVGEPAHRGTQPWVSSRFAPRTSSAIFVSSDGIPFSSSAGALAFPGCTSDCRSPSTAPSCWSGHSRC